MNNETSRQQLESIKEIAQINLSVEKLRIKLKNFTVIDRQSETIGEVQDIILGTNRQINFVISQNNNQSSRQFLLISKLVQKVDPSNRSVIVDISKAEIDAFPEYVKQETPGMETPELPDNTETPAYEAADKDITIEGDFYPSVMPAANTDPFNLDSLEMGSTFPVEISEEDITIDSDFYSSEIPPTTSAEADINDLFNLASEETVSTSEVGLADTQQWDDLIDTDNSEVLEEELIRLLGERLIVGRSKRKVGEVIVRKEIETRMIQVPVRREKLIIEQVSPEHKQLAEIDLGEAEISGVELTAAEMSGTKMPTLARSDNELTVTGEFSSPKIASLLLNAIALERRQGCKKVRLEIVVEDVERQKSYQEWIERASGNTPSSNV